MNGSMLLLGDKETASQTKDGRLGRIEPSDGTEEPNWRPITTRAGRTRRTFGPSVERVSLVIHVVIATSTSR